MPCKERTHSESEKRTPCSSGDRVLRRFPTRICSSSCGISCRDLGRGHGALQKSMYGLQLNQSDPTELYIILQPPRPKKFSGPFSRAHKECSPHQSSQDIFKTSFSLSRVSKKFKHFSVCSISPMGAGVYRGSSQSLLAMELWRPVVGGDRLPAMVSGDRFWRIRPADGPRTWLHLLCFLGAFVLLGRDSCPLYPVLTYLYLYMFMYGILN